MGGRPIVDGQSLLKQPWDPTAPAESAGGPILVGNCKDESSLFSTQNPGLQKLDEGLQTVKVPQTPQSFNLGEEARRHIFAVVSLENKAERRISYRYR